MRKFSANIKTGKSTIFKTWKISNFKTNAPAFNPIRSGFVNVNTIEVVDVFGQRVNLRKPSDCFASYSMSPRNGDKSPKAPIFLPPRILSPSRTWFKCISAETNLPELSNTPNTNPVNGWVVPNHLDQSLVFYNADGSGIGSFRVDGTSTLAYQTWPGNPSSNTLTTDIGAQGHPKADVNAYLANFMWYVNHQGTAKIQFFKDLMTTIENAESNSLPKSYQESEALSVLIGNPLALTRVNMGIETAGNLLPLNQSAASSGNPYVENINNFDKDPSFSTYQKRMTNSTAKLSTVNLPIQLGDLANFDDGLAAFVVESSGTDPYSNATIYSASADASMKSGVQQPSLSTVKVTLNDDPLTATLLMDPRCYVHATTGILPVKKMKLPADFYKSALSNIAVSFYTRPVLRGSSNFSIPIPSETGYDWEWIVEKATAESIQSQEVSEVPKWGYSPQEIFEGWLNLKQKK